MSARLAALGTIAVMALFGEQSGLQGAASEAAIDVNFTLTDLDYKPIANAPVRLVFNAEPGRQPITAGYSFVTDANGQQAFVARAAIDKKLKKVPTNFVDSLLSTPKETDHLAVAAELGYAGFRWLYAIDIYRFPNGGDVMLDGLAVYNRDRQGRFTNQATYDGRNWKMPDLNGMMLTTAGYDPWDFALQPKEGVPGAWTLKLAFKKYAEPVRR